MRGRYAATSDTMSCDWCRASVPEHERPVPAERDDTHDSCSANEKGPPTLFGAEYIQSQGRHMLVAAELND